MNDVLIFIGQHPVLSVVIILIPFWCIASIFSSIGNVFSREINIKHECSCDDKDEDEGFINKN